MAKDVIRQIDALEYHEKKIPGKIEVVPTKETKSQRDLALAYSPGVAEPCKKIAENKEDVYKYTTKGNLVAVISNGTAVLGLGNIGPEASKPVMEGKGVLFKIFAGIDVFDIEVDVTDIDKFCEVVKALEPTFGGINLEDIKAPECFEIETRLKKEMNIPVMHDDQHGTAIISGAALINALEIAEKKASEVKVVVSGAGASALSCIKIFVELGVRRENVIVCDSKGVIRADRDNLTDAKRDFATEQDFQKLEDAIVDADVFLGLSQGNVLSAEMLKTMAYRPIVFALANPTPEIDYDLAMSTRDDIIMATGRSDHPNQVNNVLGFPYIFRGAMDVRSTQINEKMKLAAVTAIAELTKQVVPDSVTKAYNLDKLNFGDQYIIPKPLDHRLLTVVAPAVAKAAIDSGVAQQPIEDWEAYEEELLERMGQGENVMRRLSNRAKQTKKRIVFAEADNPKALKAIQMAVDDDMVEPILLGSRSRIRTMIEALELDGLNDVTIINPRSDESEEVREKYAEEFYLNNLRKGVIKYEAVDMMNKRNYFGSMMVEKGDADAMISGASRDISDAIKPALKIIGTDSDEYIASMYMILTNRGPLFLADTTINEEPSAEQLAVIADKVALRVREDFDITPRIAMLSYSNFGSVKGDTPNKMKMAAKILKKKRPDLVVEGEIQANFALDTEMMKEYYSFSELSKKPANILIFPNLSSANITYKILQEMENVMAVGPIMLGMKKPVHLLPIGADVREIFNMITVANIDAQKNEKAQ